MTIGSLKTGSIYTCVRGLLTVLCLALLLGCGHHQPAPVEEQSTAPVKRQLNSDGTYRVRSGDTLYAIAFDYDLDARKVAKWNGISSPYVIYPGQQLRLSAPPVKSTPANSGKVVTAAGATKATTPGKASVSKTADPKSWKWPTSGRVLRGFLAGDPARNGIDIGGREGQAISASAGGQVVYSGNGLISYGELIIIKHSENMISAYAHNKIRLVKEGDGVSSGQKIAEMGRNAGNEQLLHFEIRVRGKPANPLTYLPQR